MIVTENPYCTDDFDVTPPPEIKIPHETEYGFI